MIIIMMRIIIVYRKEQSKAEKGSIIIHNRLKQYATLYQHAQYRQNSYTYHVESHDRVCSTPLHHTKGKL
jgi:hypothetical protein